MTVTFAHFHGNKMFLPPVEEATESPRGRPPVIRDYNNKRIAIPQKRPIKAIRKPIHSHDARSMERAGLASVILLFHSLGIYLYWLVSCCHLP